ncbi:hypothetical protein BTHERMOSOX_1006 [Bathymodiolus thermophilus thioautotrophic gill symbiont]|uniref:Uncharacterized protein n=1 Tax=Bathymodiolus thermophilus thioautotrophic gill symbiont TaxID=2360 RepID=A0A1J5TZT8_9GAMM|nr:hypothetical protein [Bathymodiolus thermophilus thioautotrophic gill symbiont]AYQ56817.1 hypothetical protein MS2017_1113 [Bathymodiolus thermophilus thioautotrophic gill symbiont]OIR25756.1 hypothetical protein BGC33_15390 [Bathymodiolus thermophilus thioautotrophic gill symbiont]CAB5495687.1 hypothetical protein THERMOS_343 [Bathymodiolus thermophilus thioautotrophic gill symbiont]CAB5499649.1 hypothetical protein THERMOT_1090 [Bathymodiolus thermophilus thioautotrophic gill symbiont]SHA
MDEVKVLNRRRFLSASFKVVVSVSATIISSKLLAYDTKHDSTDVKFLDLKVEDVTPPPADTNKKID